MKIEIYEKNKSSGFVCVEDKPVNYVIHQEDAYWSISVRLYKTKKGYVYNEHEYIVIESRGQSSHPQYCDYKDDSVTGFKNYEDAYKYFQQVTNKLAEEYPDN